jgi:TetR/AcrR family transcriptional regulator, repressor for uid operon
MRKTDQNLIDRRTLEILEAALRCFAKTGFSAASMRDIASEAGVSLGLLYRYFDSKATIIAAAIRADSGEFSVRLNALTPDRLTSATLLAFLEAEVALRSEATMFALTAEIIAEASRHPAIAALIRLNVQLAEADLTKMLSLLHRSGETPRTKRTIENQASHLLGLVDLYAARKFFDLKVNYREGLKLAMGL